MGSDPQSVGRRRLRARLRALAIAGVVGTLLFGHLASAQADTPEGPAGENVELMAMKGECKDRDGCGDVEAAFVCALGAMVPRFNGTDVVSGGRLDCDFSAPDMYLQVALYHDGELVVIDSISAQNVAGLELQVEDPCSPGLWQGRATAEVVSLSGRGHRWSSETEWVALSCTTTTTRPPRTTTTRPCPPQAPDCEEN